LLLRLHFYAGVFIGPFIFIAALSGAAYALTPQLEQLVYDHELHAPAAATSLSLGEQIEAADAYLGTGESVAAVRPAPAPGDTTRVLYNDPTLGESERRAIFVDPATGEIRGDLVVYGTSGALPLRTWVDQLHRSLHLGDLGRIYSETAASWLGVIAVAGIGLWIVRFRRARRPRQRAQLLRPAMRTRGYARTRSLHASTGLWLLVFALFLSATGITWSQFGGANFTALRDAVGWTTPTLNTTLGGDSTGHGDGHTGHHHASVPQPTDSPDVDPARFDEVLQVAQQVNVNTGLVEIVPPADVASAWVVQEIQRSYPTEVDSVAIDGDTLEAVDRVDFVEFNLIGKLSRWGIDLHMGSMFGLANQLVLFVVALSIAAMVV
jgi:uncharacterized iron-regulated membrane protein